MTPAGPTMSSGIFSPSIDLTGYRKSAATVPTSRKPIVKTSKGDLQRDDRRRLDLGQTPLVGISILTFQTHDT
jgi:hypothetical protein